ncbi:hypothetical protein [Streptomyces anulatus]|uniref:hypothetical protein n=1 Tax=Streptomyces anulatus TaxID=1892 RepID=UPI001C26716A|nr:hypothetical protein [Streptomyces anulatus]
MNAPAPRPARTFPHRWCTSVGRLAVVAGVLPALFGGAAPVMLLALILVGGLGALMLTCALHEGPTGHHQPARAAFALTSDALLVLVACGVLLGALLASTGDTPLLSAGDTVMFLAGFAILCALQHLSHRRSHHRRRR